MDSTFAKATSQFDSREVVRVSITEFREKFGEILQGIRENDDWVVVTEDGEAVAATISMEAFEFFLRMYERVEDKIDLAAVRKAKEDSDDGETMTLEEFKRQLDD
ncbi:MAG: type II toxin-antitoxin system Phd/YefM family antitoxin [Cyanobacteria bacterium SID2]|nr:type II toxin-antitoxin system Phd/YefM family antitoxin [Cyanobacteria bacterium SID2]MBP0002985.1 type II toxin-antitoxin system Phd/YefM family antitoxin [Cyanobacteria bacterium SBC]